MATKAIRSLRLDSSGVFIEQHGITPQALHDFAPQLEAARRELLEVDRPMLHAETPVPPAIRPFDAGFLDWPERLLAEYNATRPTSELHLILQKANCLRDTVDRVVVLGAGGSHFAVKALMEACCDPYFNELSRGQRGSRPRMYLEGNHLDNDASQGLLSLLGNGRPANSVHDRWAIVVVDKNGETPETEIAFQQFLAALQKSCDGNAAQVAEFVIPVTGKSGKLFDIAKELGCQSIFSLPVGVADRFSLFTAAGVMPAAILGIDVVKLLEGAIAMNEHFRTAPPGENLVLQWAAIIHLLRERHGLQRRTLNVWAKCLESTRMWYDQLLAERLERQASEAVREVAQQALCVDVVADQWRCDLLKVGYRGIAGEEIQGMTEKTLPQVLAEQIAKVKLTRLDHGQPAVSLHLPIVNAASMGQLFQMLMLTTALEGQLDGGDPHGPLEPGQKIEI